MISVLEGGTAIARSRRADYDRNARAPRDTTRINHNINAPQVRLIDHEKNNRGIVSLQEALRIANEADMDLVEVSSGGSSQPPVCRIMDYSKYRYEKQKREKAARSGSKAKQVKEVRLTPKIGQHDLEIKVKHAIEFIEDGHRVQFTMRFKGREKYHAEIGREVLERVIEMMADVAKVELAPQRQGRRMYMLMVPLTAEQRNRNRETQNQQESADN